MIVRDARSADLPANYRLVGQLADVPDAREFEERFNRVSQVEGHKVIVTEIEGEVSGVLHVFERPALEKPCEAVVQALVAAAGRRGSGIGEALMREAERWAKGRGLSSVALYTRTDREPARRFYERLGYRLKATSHLLGRGSGGK